MSPSAREPADHFALIGVEPAAEGDDLDIMMAGSYPVRRQPGRGGGYGVRGRFSDHAGISRRFRARVRRPAEPPRDGGGKRRVGFAVQEADMQPSDVVVGADFDLRWTVGRACEDQLSVLSGGDPMPDAPTSIIAPCAEMSRNRPVSGAPPEPRLIVHGVSIGMRDSRRRSASVVAVRTVRTRVVRNSATSSATALALARRARPAPRWRRPRGTLRTSGR